MILYGDKGESGKIYLTPSDGTTFEPGKQYRVSVNIKDIGKVFEVFMFPYDLQWPMYDILHDQTRRTLFDYISIHREENT